METHEASDVVLVERREAVAVITLNRPEVRNALNAELRTELHRALVDANNSDVSAIVLTGADPGFCAGLDLKALASDGLPGPEAAKLDTASASSPFPKLNKPVIRVTQSRQRSRVTPERRFGGSAVGPPLVPRSTSERVQHQLHQRLRQQSHLPSQPVPLLTGRMPSIHGGIFTDRSLESGANTFVRTLRSAGYRTGLIGKSHLQLGMGIEMIPPAALEGAVRASESQRQPTISVQRRPPPGSHSRTGRPLGLVLL